MDRELILNEKLNISFKGTVKKFPGPSGWHYIAVPKKYTRELQKQRKSWGMYPITAHIGSTTWKTKLMIKKGGDFFIALKLAIQNKEKLALGDRVSIFFRLE